MSDAVDFFVCYYQIGKRIIFQLQAPTCLHNIFYHTSSFLYRSIIFLSNLLQYFHNTFLVHSSDDLHAPVKNNQFKNNPLPM